MVETERDMADGEGKTEWFLLVRQDTKPAVFLRGLLDCVACPIVSAAAKAPSPVTCVRFVEQCERVANIADDRYQDRQTFLPASART